jgi:hypothetical protein
LFSSSTLWTQTPASTGRGWHCRCLRCWTTWHAVAVWRWACFLSALCLRLQHRCSPHPAAPGPEPEPAAAGHPATRMKADHVLLLGTQEAIRGDRSHSSPNAFGLAAPSLHLKDGRVGDTLSRFQPAQPQHIVQAAEHLLRRGIVSTAFMPSSIVLCGS